MPPPHGAVEEPGAHEPGAVTGVGKAHAAGCMMVVVEAPELCGGFVSKCSNGDGAQPGQSGRATHWAIGEH